MSNCTNCGTYILFGGIKDGAYHFCCKKCQQQFMPNQEDLLLHPLIDLDDIVEQQLNEFHQGDCPQCGGPGPVDFHYSYRCVSVIITLSTTVPQVSCKYCARSSKLKNLFITGFFGWWGFPVGLILTPIFIIKNLYALFCPTPAEQPSEQLRQVVRAGVIEQMREIAALPQNQEENIDDDEVEEEYDDEYEEEEEEEKIAENRFLK
jgi:hypothetical protein